MSRLRAIDAILRFVLRADRDDKASADPQLRFQSGRNLSAAGRHDNGPEAAIVGPALRPVSVAQNDVAIAEPVEALLRPAHQAGVALDGTDLGGELRATAAA